jgi:hypothetical protein
MSHLPLPLNVLGRTEIVIAAPVDRETTPARIHPVDAQEETGEFILRLQRAESI